MFFRLETNIQKAKNSRGNSRFFMGENLSWQFYVINSTSTPVILSYLYHLVPGWDFEFRFFSGYMLFCYISQVEIQHSLFAGTNSQRF